MKASSFRALDHPKSWLFWTNFWFLTCTLSEINLLKVSCKTTIPYCACNSLITSIRLLFSTHRAENHFCKNSSAWKSVWFWISNQAALSHTHTCFVHSELNIATLNLVKFYVCIIYYIIYYWCHFSMYCQLSPVDWNFSKERMVFFSYFWKWRAHRQRIPAMRELIVWTQRKVC